jgi:outer membrane murein-binding lipoprotein Lpp
MKRTLNATFVSAGVAVILLSGCVSSKKYHASQAETARVREDSAKLAQQVSTLNGTVQDLQSKNSTLQQSVEAANGRTAATQKSLDYYQNYFKEQQSMMGQMSDDVKTALTQAGVANGDVQQVNNTIFVRLDEDELFKKNSTMVSANGKKALDGLAGVIKGKDNVNVFVGGGDSVSGDMAAMNPTPQPVHKVRHHRPAQSAGSSAQSSGGASNGSTAANSNTSGGTTGSTPVHKKVHHHYSSEGSMAIYNGPGRHNRSWALKQARMASVAHNFLQNGVAKVNVSLRQSDLTANQDKTIRVVIVPKMEDFNPQSGGSR